MNTEVFIEHEANVRSYCRSFPEVFQRAKGSVIYGESGKEYIDFFSGAGALNYGHNNDFIKQYLISYIERDGVMHGLDMYTTTKREFLQKFWQEILVPKGLDYKVMFCAPTGTNAVEAALKLARKITHRTTIFAFAGSYHGLSLGSLAVTAHSYHRLAAGVPLNNVSFMPFPGTEVSYQDSIAYIESVLNDPWSGYEKPAALIFETVQAEGGVNVAPVEWIRQIRDLCYRHSILLICDDIQAGCGRTGTFFSFEPAEIIPDMVTLSKSISGYGQPMALLLFKTEHDVWKPAEHTGTFRGNQLAFVGATAAIDYFHQQNIPQLVQERSAFLEQFLSQEIGSLFPELLIRGKGMIWGIDCTNVPHEQFAREISRSCFDHGLLLECVGRNDTVLKILPPLNIELSLLKKGCGLLKSVIESQLNTKNRP